MLQRSNLPGVLSVIILLIQAIHRLGLVPRVEEPRIKPKAETPTAGS